MSKNIKLNNTNYNGVSTVQLPTTNGGTATFKDTDEITTPSGSTSITENGTFDVANFAQAIVNVATSGGSTGNGVTITPYEVTENADRSLWLNEKQIKLVKGINLLVSSKMAYNVSGTLNQGAISMIYLQWDGVECIGDTSNGSMHLKNHLRGIQVAQSAYALAGTVTALTAGSTTKHSVASDGTLTLTTSATGVTTENYNNSYFEGGNTYYLVQIPNDTVC